MRRIAVLDAPSNLGLRPPTATSVPGVYKAPGALRDQGLIARLHARDAGCLTPPRYDPGDWRPGDGVAQSEQIAAYSRRLADRIGAIIDAGEFPVVLGGDCSIVIGSGLAMHRLGQAVGGRIGLVFVDGHSDFRHPGNASYVGAAAGEDLALVTGRGQADLAAIETRRPYFRDVDVVVMGIRAQDEYRLDLQAAGIVTRPVPTLRVEGAARSAQWAREQLVDCAGFWVHVDVDVLDPAVMPAVDAPEPGGIAFPELELLLAGLVDTPHCLGVEITVFDPDYDPDGAYAAEIASTLVGGLAPARTVPARPDLVAARHALTQSPAARRRDPAFGTEPAAFRDEPAAFRGEPGAFGVEPAAFGAEPAAAFQDEPVAFGAESPARGSEPAAAVRGYADETAAVPSEPTDASGRPGSRLAEPAERPGAGSAAEPPSATDDAVTAPGRLGRRAGGLAERADLISSAGWSGRLDPGPGRLGPRSDADRPGGLRRRDAGSDPATESVEQRRAAAAADSVTLAAAGASGADTFGAGTTDETAIPATTLLGVEESPETPAFTDPLTTQAPATYGRDPSTEDAGSVATDATGPTAEDSYEASADSSAATTGGHSNDAAADTRPDMPHSPRPDTTATEEAVHPDALPHDEHEHQPWPANPGEPEASTAHTEDPAWSAEPNEPEATGGQAEGQAWPAEADEPEAPRPEHDEPEGRRTEPDAAEPVAVDETGGEAAPAEQNGPVIPAQPTSRPLGSAPLLDSEPLPATRPGRLRPREIDTFSLPAQRPAFDAGTGDSADIA